MSCRAGSLGFSGCTLYTCGGGCRAWFSGPRFRIGVGNRWHEVPKRRYPVQGIEIRLLSNSDSLEALTELIHRAYRQLAELGFRYWGTHQTVDDTRNRISLGECFVACARGKVVATVTLNLPKNTDGHPWYERPDVASFHQFAVEPSFQRRGIGSRLLTTIEKRAYELGARELGCDTAEGASHLIAWYIARGFRQVGKASWDVTNYESLLFSKTLTEKVMRES